MIITALRSLTALVAVWSLAGCDDPPPDASTPPEQPPGHAKMVSALREVAARTDSDHYYQGGRRARELTKQLEEQGENAPWRLYLDAGTAELQLGNERAGIAILENAHQRLVDGRLRGGLPARAEISFHLGVGYLRLAETQNCCAIPSPESCILPIRGGGLHQDREGSEQAVRYFREVLDANATGEYWRLSAQWLLNIAHMTLGDYPDGVPEDVRIPESAFESKTPAPRMRNIGAALGVNTFSLSGSTIVDDFDGDDYLDILISTWDTQGRLQLFVNQRDGTFAERGEAAGLGDLLGGLNMVQADYDNDGDLDFLVLRGAWLFEHGRHPNSLVRNNGDGTFTDVTFDAGLGRVHYPTQTAAWADYDNDGDLDLCIGNESRRSARAPSQLFRNNGDGTFTDVAGAAGVRHYGFTKAVAWGDYDADGFVDLYISNNGETNVLYRNQGDGTFTEVSSDLGVGEPRDSFPAWFWDFDNDGKLDLYVSSYGTGIAHISAYHLDRPMAQYETAKLYRGGDGAKFEDVAQTAGLDYPAMPMGANFGDLDNDGFLDFYLGTGNVYYFSVMPNLMYRNDGGTRFDDVTMAAGLGHLQKGHGVAFADLDNDGDVDIVEQLGGAFAGDGFRDTVFENPGNDNHWLTVHLVGTESNRCAIGARIRVVVKSGDASRSIYRHVNSGASFGANPLRQTIGLGDATAIERIEVLWPKTGETQTLTGVGMDRAIRITEGSTAVQTIELEKLSLAN